MNIYVDYSYTESFGGIGIIAEKAGKVIGNLAIRTKSYPCDLGEMLALLLGTSALSIGDTVLTDQLAIIESLEKHGEVKYPNRVAKPERSRVQRVLNKVLQTKEGVTIQHVISHKNNPFNHLADNLAKVASQCRQLCPGSPLDIAIGNNYIKAPLKSLEEILCTENWI